MKRDDDIEVLSLILALTAALIAAGFCAIASRSPGLPMLVGIGCGLWCVWLQRRGE